MVTQHIKVHLFELLTPAFRYTFLQIKPISDLTTGLTSIGQPLENSEIQVDVSSCAEYVGVEDLRVEPPLADRI